MDSNVTVLPYVPTNITVHLGPPNSDAANVTVPFADYIKNVASSEIYPTWDSAALRANILAQISFALNRVYTEYYPSRGYNFNITSSTAIDQKFINGRNIFENISALTDEIFNDYIRRTGFVEPLSARFCNGTTVTCDGLSQWGSQALAEQGYSSLDILRNYYGNNIEVVVDAPIENFRYSYPGTALRSGSSGRDVVLVQVTLNRISQDYPSIPKIYPVDGIFGPQTEASVKRFQSIFGLTADGIVGKATWYKLIQLYVGVLDLSELVSEGQTYFRNILDNPGPASEGDTGQRIRDLQYILSVLSEFISEIPQLSIDGIFGPATKNAVIAWQKYVSLPQTGIVDEATWDSLYRAWRGIEELILSDPELFPFERSGSGTAQGGSAALNLQRQLNAVAGANPSISPVRLSGQIDNLTRRSLMQYQSFAGLNRTGRPDRETAASLAEFAKSLPFARSTRMTQFPGYDLRLGSSDHETEQTQRRRQI